MFPSLPSADTSKREDIMEKGTLMRLSLPSILLLLRLF